MARLAGDSTHYTFRLSPDYAIELVSSTSVIKAVMGASGGGMAYWGFKNGIRSQHPKMDDEAIEKLYERAKRSEWAPNAQRDAAGARGNKAHEVLEALAKYGGVPEGITPGPYEWAVKKWWDENMDGWEVVASERPLWSLKYGFAGTVDLIRRRKNPYVVEIVDLKTHKPPVRFEDLVQVASYELAYGEMTGELFLDQRIVIAQPDGNYTQSDPERDYVDPDAFVALKAVWDEMQREEVNK